MYFFPSYRLNNSTCIWKNYYYSQKSVNAIYPHKKQTRIILKIQIMLPLKRIHKMLISHKNKNQSNGIKHFTQDRRR